MTSSNCDKLDNFLSKHDHESMDWCDGGESDVAEGFLNVFEEPDWKQLKNVYPLRDSQWQCCLISILSPYCGFDAQDVILDLAKSQNEEVAFEAMYAISFYCGINANSEGLFIDQSIVHSEFKERLVSNAQFLELIPKIGKLVGRKYELLQQVLVGQP